MKLRLPPLPGTNTAHPSFEIRPDVFGSMRPQIEIEKGHWFYVKGLAGKINPVAAAAIAHYWGAEKYLSGHIEPDDASTQLEAWPSIAAGSSDYDGAEIVGYAP